MKTCPRPAPGSDADCFAQLRLALSFGQWGRVGHGPQNYGWVGHSTFAPWPICSLPLRKISKIGDTKCTKFAFCWGFAPEPVGGAYSASSNLL